MQFGPDLFQTSRAFSLKLELTVTLSGRVGLKVLDHASSINRWLNCHNGMAWMSLLNG